MSEKDLVITIASCARELAWERINKSRERAVEFAPSLAETEAWQVLEGFRHKPEYRDILEYV